MVRDGVSHMTACEINHQQRPICIVRSMSRPTTYAYQAPTFESGELARQRNSRELDHGNENLQHMGQAEIVGDEIHHHTTDTHITDMPAKDLEKQHARFSLAARRRPQKEVAQDLMTHPSRVSDVSDTTDSFMPPCQLALLKPAYCGEFKPAQPVSVGSRLGLL